MTRPWDDDALRAALHEVGETTPQPSTALADRVLDRLAGESAPARSTLAGVRARSADVVRWMRARILRLAALLAALVFGVAVSPVGAQVAEWFDFHGVLIGPERGDSDDVTPTVPPARGDLTIEEAADLVAFDVGVPAELGEPDAVSVSSDRRILSMSWGQGADTVRLDQFDGRLEPRFYKASDDAVRVDVSSRDGLWFPSPHHVELLDEPREPITVPPRLAAQTLVWELDGVTFRLEGPFTAGAAVAVAESVR